MPDIGPGTRLLCVESSSGGAVAGTTYTCSEIRHRTSTSWCHKHDTGDHDGVLVSEIQCRGHSAFCIHQFRPLGGDLHPSLVSLLREPDKRRVLEDA